MRIIFYDPVYNTRKAIPFFLYRFSKQAFLSDVLNPHTLPDKSPSFKDFMGNKNNRFLNPTMASKNRIQPPSKVITIVKTFKFRHRKVFNNKLKPGFVPPSKLMSLLCIFLMFMKFNSARSVGRAD
jgi:hypothetical protein